MLYCGILAYRTAAFLTDGLFFARTQMPADLCPLSVSQKAWVLEEEVLHFWSLLHEHSDRCYYDDSEVGIQMLQKFYDASQQEVRKMKGFMNYRCWTCKKLLLGKRKHCAMCGLATYCSAKCQKEDWPRHKFPCVRPFVRDLLGQIIIRILSRQYLITRAP